MVQTVRQTALLMGKFIQSVVVVILLLALAFAQQSSEPFAVLEAGDFHGQEVALNQPASWAGVYCQKSICSVRPVTVRSSRVPDPLGIDEPNQPTGTSIVVTPGPAAFLVRGIARSPRSIPTAFFGDRRLIAGEAQSFTILGTHYVLRVEGKANAEDQLPKDSRLVFSNGSVTQQLFSPGEDADEPHITVLWIGDLDGDEKPDLYINSSYHYNLEHKVLWLSSLAKAGQLVGQAAVFDTTGC